MGGVVSFFFFLSFFSLEVISFVLPGPVLEESMTSSLTIFFGVLNTPPRGEAVDVQPFFQDVKVFDHTFSPVTCVHFPQPWYLPLLLDKMLFP